MFRIARQGLALVLALSFLVAAPALRAQDRAPPIEQRDRVWAQTYSDLKPDPAIRFRTLPNGMRYALMHNATPSRQASIRMRVGTGSLSENENQLGLAHFLEHMAFNGSKNVPQGEMIRILERHGLAFGADTNASTDWTETVYQLDLPQTDAETLDTGLMLMREAAGSLTLDPKAMDTERGVVLSEERARDTPAYRVFKARLDFLLKGQLAARRLPIGTVGVLRSAPVQEIRNYYEAFYRPDRTTLVVVGDFDVDEVEAKIKARFSDWAPVRPAGPEPELGKVAKRNLEARLIVEPGGPTSVSVSWVRPFDATPDSEAKRRRDMVETIAFQVLNRRLERMARGDQPPFIGAAAGSDDYFRSATITTLSVNAAPGKWREGLTAAEEARRRAIQFGLRQDEVDREVSELRSMFQSAADGAATRRTPRIASGLASSVDSGEVYTSPQEDLALFDRAVKGLTADEVHKALRDTFQGEGPLVFLSSPEAVQGGEPAVLAAYKAAQDSKLTPPPAQEVKTWPYESFGAPGKVAETRQALDLDTTFVRFENGVRLTVKPTKFRKDQILVAVRFGDGRLEMPRDRQTASWAAGFGFIQGGLKQIDLEDMEQVLASKIYNVDLSVGDDSFVLSGGTRPQDFETQLQVLTAYIAEPGWRPGGFERMKTLGPNLLRQLAATPQGVMRRDMGELMRSGDQRWSFPSLADMQAAQPGDLQTLLGPALARGSVEVLIVGDVSVERATEVVAATLGALPPRQPTKPAAEAFKIAFPAPTAQPVVLTHEGRADQAVAFLAWPTKDFFADPQEQRALRLLQLVFERRLVDQIRIAQGATYSPSADWDASLVFPGYGYISADVEIPPEKIAGFYADVSKIAADLRQNLVSADELERARKPRIEAIEKSQQTNEYWLSQLAGGAEDARRLDAIRAATAGLQRVTAEDIRRAAQTYLTDERAWKLVAKSKDAK